MGRLVTRQRELVRKAARARFWSRMAPALGAVGVGLGGAAIAAEWTGFDRLSDPFAIAVLGALLLAFAVTNLPGVTGEGDVGDHVPLPPRSSGTDGD